MGASIYTLVVVLAILGCGYCTDYTDEIDLNKLCVVPKLSGSQVKYNDAEQIWSALEADGRHFLPQQGKLHYDCGGDWKTATCLDGRWTEIEESCKGDGSSESVIDIERKQVMEPSNSKVYHFKLCPKGKQVNSCESKRGKETCTVEGKWYQIGDSVYSGFQGTADMDFYECKDLNECTEMKAYKQNMKMYVEESSGMGGYDDDDDDQNSVQLPRHYMEERGIDMICGEKTRCKNTEDGYRCECKSEIYTKTSDTTCEWKDCKDVDELANGRIITMQGFRITFKCDQHFQLNPDKSVFNCKHGVWTHDSGKTYDEIQPKCLFADGYCGIPTSPEHGRNIHHNSESSGTATYGCDVGYTRFGPYERQCQLTGHWNKYQPQCREYIPLFTEVTRIRQEYLDSTTSANTGKVCIFPSFKGKVRYGSLEVQSSGLAGDLIPESRSISFFCKRWRRATCNNGQWTRISNNCLRENLIDGLMDVYFLIDTSLATRGQNRVDEIVKLCKAVAKSLLSTTQERPRISVATLGNNTVYSVFNFSQSNEHEAFDQIKYKGGIYNQIKGNRYLTDLLMRDNSRRKRVLIELTDGSFDTTEDEWLTTRRALANLRGIDKVIMVGIGSIIRRQNLEKASSNFREREIIELDWNLSNYINKKESQDKSLQLCGVAGPTERTEVEKKKNRHQFFSGSRQEVPEGSYPWLVGVYGNNMEFRGAGNIVCNNWILTSKSSITDPTSQEVISADALTIAAGPHYILKDRIQSNSLVMAVKTVHTHSIHDMALLKLKSPLPSTGFVRPVCLPKVTNGILEDSSAPLPDDEASFVGWGGKEFNFGRDKTSLNKLRLKECEQPSEEDVESTTAPIVTVATCLYGEDENGTLTNTTAGEEDDDSTMPCTTPEPTDPPSRAITSDICPDGEAEICELDVGGALLKKLPHQYGINEDRFVAVGIAKKPDLDNSCSSGRFVSLTVATLEWINDVLHGCNEIV